MMRSMIAAFCALAVWSSAGNADQSGAAYLLSPGDVVMVSVWQEDSLRQEATVLPDGSITFPLAGRINVAGLDVTAVEKQVAAKLEKFLPDPNVSVVVKSIAGNLV